MTSRRANAGCFGTLVLLAILVAGAGAFVADLEPAPTTVMPSTRPTARIATESATPRRTTSPPPSSRIHAAKNALPGLAVKGRAPLTGYEREAFGTAWSDTDDNGCDTRNDILRRDLSKTVVQDCVVLSGVLDDPYSGDRVVFVRGPVTSMDVQIDHVVALSNAWQTGAKYWTDDRRERFANDRRNLLAVRGDLNLQKSDGDAATWLPPKKSFRCTYVSIQILTKHRYGLWVTPPEQQAMQRVLATC
jgi:hypothetical protein